MPSLQLRIFCGAFSHIFETWKQTLKMCWLHRFLPKQLKHRWRDCLWKQTSRLGNICVFWHIQYGICFCLTRVSSSVSKRLLGITPSLVQSLPLTWAGTVLNLVCVYVCVCVWTSPWEETKAQEAVGLGWNTGHCPPWLCSTFPPKDQLSFLKLLC